MNADNFGDLLKELRSKKKLSSRNLSSLLGKYPAYISQLERQIMKPDYEMGIKILCSLGLDDEKANGILNFFDIYSDQDKIAIERLDIQAAEEMYAWLDSKAANLKSELNRFMRSMEILIAKDLTRAEVIFTNLLFLAKDEKNLNIFAELNKYPLNQVEENSIKEAVKAFNKSIETKYYVDDYGDFVERK